MCVPGKSKRNQAAKVAAMFLHQRKIILYPIIPAQMTYHSNPIPLPRERVVREDVRGYSRGISPTFSPITSTLGGNNLYITGVTKRESNVELINPPIITKAKGE